MPLSIGIGVALSTGAEAAAGATFPDVTLRDDFNRTNAASLGANWALAFGGDTDPEILGNTAAVGATTGLSAAAWQPATFGPDVAVCATLATLPGGVASMQVFARFDDGLGASYMIGYDGSQIYIANALGWLGDAVSTAPLIVGNKLGIVCRGTTIQGWVYRSGAWEKLIEQTDSDYGGAGAAGIAISDDGDALAVDDFSAATL